MQWKAIYGIQLFRPEGGGQMGGAQIAFRRHQKNTVFTVTSDEGEVAVVDWAVKPTDEDRKPGNNMKAELPNISISHCHYLMFASETS